MAGRIKLSVRGGLLYYTGKDAERQGDKGTVSCPDADRIAKANGYYCAEQIVRAYDGQLITLDKETHKVLAKIDERAAMLKALQYCAQWGSEAPNADKKNPVRGLDEPACGRTARELLARLGVPREG